MRIALRAAVLLSTVATIATGCAAGSANRGEQSGTLITRDLLARNPNDPLARVLERYVTGIQVTRTSDGALAVRIRGAPDLVGRDPFPLYILDGSPIPTGPEGAVPDISTFNIESIRVLKGSEAAVYGIEGSNGAIVITTRRGPTR